MMRAGAGLTTIPTEVLRNLLRRVHGDELDFPITADVLACMGMQDRSEALLGTLRGLSQSGVRAVLVAVIAERAGR